MQALQTRTLLASLVGLILTNAAMAQDVREPALLPPVSLQAPFAGEPLLVSEANPAEPIQSPVGQSGRSTLELLPPPPAASVSGPLPGSPGASPRGERRSPTSPWASARRWLSAKPSMSARLWSRSARATQDVR
jgi:hypothetical protein